MSTNESDLIERLHAVAEGFEMPRTAPAEDAWRGRRRVRRNRALVGGAAAAVLAVVIGLNGTLAGQDRAGTEPVQQPEQVEQIDPGTLADVHGWIVFGGRDGLRAVDPSRPSDQEPKPVTDVPGNPLGWSSDGTKLLVASTREAQPGQASGADLFVLHADGTETLLASGGSRLQGSISPDGSQVVYSDVWSGDGAIYVVATGGGTPVLLHAPEPEPDPEADPGGAPAMFDRETYHPVFSPDGTQIAFFDGHGDWGHRLRVMDADGSGARTLWTEGVGHIHGLTWSPDGRRLMFSNDDGTWMVGIDASGLAQAVEGTEEFGMADHAGAYPAWSPDGSRIAYHRSSWVGGFGQLCLARADGPGPECFTKAQLAEAGIQWNPLPLEGSDR